MKIKPVQFEAKLDKDKSRSSGVHLSDVVRSIALEAGILDKRRALTNLKDQPSILRAALGRSFEDWFFEHQHPDVLYHPGEVCVDGIIMSIDGISFSGGGGDARVVHEGKLTWKSSVRDLSGEWMWLASTKAYCYGWGTNLARWHLFFVNGNYRESGPQYQIHDLEFSPLELQENWEMVLNHAQAKFKLRPPRTGHGGDK